MGRRSRTKGATFEREIATRLTAVLGVPVKRRLGQARDAGHDLQGAEPFIFELKRRARIGAMRWYEQAARAANTDGSDIPAVILREDNGPAAVLISLDDFLRVYGGMPK